MEEFLKKQNLRKVKIVENKTTHQPNKKSQLQKMQSNYSFDILNIEEDKLIVSAKKRESSEISFSEIEMIYVSAKKCPLLITMLLLLFSIAFIISSVLYLSLQLTLLIVPISLLLYIIKTIYYNGYELKIRLKNQSIYKTKVPLKLKNEAISKVNEIRKKVYDYQILN